MVSLPHASTHPPGFRKELSSGFWVVSVSPAAFLSTCLTWFSPPPLRLLLLLYLLLLFSSPSPCPPRGPPPHPRSSAFLFQAVCVRVCAHPSSPSCVCCKGMSRQQHICTQGTAKKASSRQGTFGDVGRRFGGIMGLLGRGGRAGSC